MMHQSSLSPVEQSVAGKACPAAVSLASVANRSFATDADGRGWTDQGPGNDLRMFRRESLEGKPFRFEILPDGEAQCLVLSRKFPDFLPEAEVDAGNRTGNHILLLHTGAWLSASVAGRLIVTYADRSSDQFEIQKGRDLSDWCQPQSFPNYKPAWYGLDGGRYRNLGISAFPVQPKPVHSLKFIAGDQSIWMVVAVNCETCESDPLKWYTSPHILDAEAKTFYWTKDPLAEIPDANFLGFLKTKHAREIKNSPVGIGFETLDRDTFDPEQVYDVLGESGIKHVRVQSGWRKIETRPGIYDFTWLDGIVENLRRRGLKVWLQLSFGNPLYTPNRKYEAFRKAHPGEEPSSGFLRGFTGDTPFYHGPGAMNAWIRFVCALVEHYKDRIREYEVWNEPDGTGLFWGFHGEAPYSGISREEMLRRTAGDFFEFTRQTADAVRRIKPDAQIVACPAVFHGIYMRELGKLGFGNVIDILACHTYDATTQAFDRAHYEQIRSIIRPKAMWMGEGGSLSKGDSATFTLHGLFAATELSQAKHNVRRLTVDAGSGMQLSSIYSMSDLKSYWSGGEDSTCGIFCNRENRPKLAYYAMQSLATLFEGLEAAPELGLYPKIELNNISVLEKNALQCFAFRKDGVPLFAVFSPETVLLNPDPIRCAFDCFMNGREITDPVVIDPLRQKVYSLPAGYTQSASGALSIPVLDVPNYPVFITDRSTIDLQ